MLKNLKKIIKDLLAIKQVRKAHDVVLVGLLSIAASSRLFATLYTVVGLFTFNREQYAVLRGRRNYYRNLSRDRVTHVELRRLSHKK